MASTRTAVTTEDHGGRTSPFIYSLLAFVRGFNRCLINESFDISARFATLAHELGHIYCGHQGAHPTGFWPDRSGMLTKQQREMEAEAVAYLVCKRLELKTRSALYLRRHATPENLSGVSKRLIIEATNRIEARS